MTLASKRIGLVAVTVLMTVAAFPFFATVFAQDATEEAPAATETYTDERISFEYPADWFVCTDCTASRDVAVGNTENALNAASFEEFNTGDVQILVVKRASRFFEQQLAAPIDNALPPDEALDAILPDELEVTAFEFDDGRQAAEVVFSDADAGINTAIWLVDMGDAQRGALLVTGATEDVEAVQEQVMTLAETLTAVEPSIPGVTDGEVTLTEAFVTESYRLQHPAEWVFTETQRGTVFFGTSAETITTERVETLFPGEVLGLIYPTVDLIPNYQPDSEINTPLDVVTFLTVAGTSDESGYQQQVAPEAIQLDEREAAVSLTADDTTAQIILSIAADDNLITLIAFTPLSTGEDARPALEAILATVETGEFEPPETDAPTATTEEAP